MLLTIRSAAVCFSTMPEQPSFIACTNSFLSSDAVSTITRVFVPRCCSVCSAANPSRFGIRRSSSTMSGSSWSNHLQRFASIGGLAHHVDVVFEAEQPAQPFPDNRMVVRDEDSDAPSRAVALSLRGGCFGAGKLVGHGQS